MKRIAILHSGDLNNVSIGGVSQYIQEIIRHEERYSVVLYGTCETGTHKIGERYTYEIDKKEYTFVPITDNSKSPLSIYYFFNLKKYYTEIEKCDVIYCQRMEYILPFWGRKSKKKTVMAVHGSGAYTAIWRGKTVAFIYDILERIAVSISGKVIVLQKRDEFGVPYYKRKYARHADKIYYGRVPIDEKVFYTLENKGNENPHIKKVLYLGRIDDNPKRVLLFPSIAERLKDSGYTFQFILIGDGTSMDNLVSEIHEKGLDDTFTLMGKVKHGPALTNLLNSGDVALIISAFEGICMSALECIACGVPVVATDVGDIKEYIKNGENGIIIPNDNNVISNAAEAVIKIFNNGCPMNKVYQKYSAQNMIDELESIFEK